LARNSRTRRTRHGLASEDRSDPCESFSRSEERSREATHALSSVSIRLKRYLPRHHVHHLLPVVDRETESGQRPQAPLPEPLVPTHRNPLDFIDASLTEF
jgi:hypothetical protein